ncbi:MAG TPA: hypothetical protein VKQ28_07785 [Candidatus Acidoferrum sp.]|nr:hypothetical protein [Candidatus Acidoferrum sp.]
MDAQGRSSAGDATGIKEQASQKAAQLKETVSDLGRKAGDKIDEGRVRTADTFDSTASALHERGERFASSASNAAHATADKIQAAADYLREHDAQAMAEDLGGLVRRYPGQALAAAAVAGFLAGRALRGGD